MRRRLFKIAVVLSVALFLATAALWVRARFARQDVIAATRGERLIRVHIKENGLVITSIAPWPRREALSWRSGAVGAPGFGIPVMFDNKSTASRTVFPGVNYDTGAGTVYDPSLPNNATTAVRAGLVVIIWAWPLGLTLALAGPLVALAAKEWVVSRSRRAKGLCLRCGYDLRGTPERCPECGATSKAQPATAA